MVENLYLFFLSALRLGTSSKDPKVRTSCVQHICTIDDSNLFPLVNSVYAIRQKLPLVDIVN